MDFKADILLVVFYWNTFVVFRWVKKLRDPEGLLLVSWGKSQMASVFNLETLFLIYG